MGVSFCFSRTFYHKHDKPIVFAIVPHSLAGCKELMVYGGNHSANMSNAIEIEH